MNMIKTVSTRFSCPGCERNNFRSLLGVRNHFIKKGHSLRCPVCQRTFQDELGIIQHYQKYNKSTSLGAPSDNHQIPPTSAPSSSAVVTPVVWSKVVHNSASEESFKSSQQVSEIPGIQFPHGLLASFPFKGVDKCPSLVAPSPISATRIYPTVLPPLEQDLILRYLRSRCHSWNRLQTEGYIIGPGSIRNKKYPRKGSIKTYDFRETSNMRLQTTNNISAIAIDCEMVEVRNGRQTLAFLSAINFLTGEVLISRYVHPDEDVIDWRHEFSGLTQSIMTSAVASGAAFGSWREARDKLLEFIDNSTVLVGHSLNYDLEVLGICHSKVVDSAILTAETVYPSIISTKPLPRMWGLKTIAKDLLKLTIQNSNCGHDALEDAFAARDVLIWCIKNPEELKVWAENIRLQEKLKLPQNRTKLGKSRPNSKLPARKTFQTRGSHDSDDIILSELADELGWPEGYDPWSD